MSHVNDTKCEFPAVQLLAQCRLPIRHRGIDLKTWTLKVFRSNLDDGNHAVLEYGDPGDRWEQPLVRIHSACFTGDVLGSQLCDCGDQFFMALQKIVDHGYGFMIYHLNHEGRGIGLMHKIRAYHLQQTEHVDTYEANERLGFARDLRRYDTSVAIIQALGLSRIILLTSNGFKASSLEPWVARTIALEAPVNQHNLEYLIAKRKFERSRSKL